MSESFSTGRGSLIHLERAGDGPVVLALHGLGGGGYFFRGLAERLGGRYQVVAIDLPGTGLSTVRAPFSLASWIADIGELVERHLAGPVIVIGHSLGTILALEAWRAWPDWIRGIVFVGGLPEVRSVVRERLSARADDIRRAGMAGWGPRVSPGIFGHTAFRERLEVIGLFERLFETQDAATYVRCTEILLGGAATPIVPTLRVPCVSISGGDDQYAPPDAVRAFMQAVPVPHDVHVLDGIGHMPFFEAPEVFATLVGQFLQGAGRSS